MVLIGAALLNNSSVYHLPMVTYYRLHRVACDMYHGKTNQPQTAKLAFSYYTLDPWI